MKIAVLSDIHGNLPALTAVADHIARWQPNQVVVNGDIVNRGPLPRPCWQFVQERQTREGWLATRGNHEDYVAAHAHALPNPADPLFQINYLSYWTFQQLNGEVETLANLPDSLTLAGANGPRPSGSQVRICHASMRGNRDGVWPFTSDEAVREQMGGREGAAGTAVFVTGHTHQSFIRRVGDTLVVNAGSAGQHGYGETRATYAQLTWRQGVWRAEIVYVPYDMAQTERDFHESGYLAEAGAVARLIFHEWRLAAPILYDWIRQYQSGVLAGEVALDASVATFLAHI